MKVTRSSLFPTAIVLPSGDHVILMFSPVKKTIYTQKTVGMALDTIYSRISVMMVKNIQVC